MVKYINTLKWYALLALLSRGAITVALLISPVFMPADHYSIVGLAFAAITSSSQIFGYPGYLSALKSNSQVNLEVDVKKIFRFPPMQIVVAALGGGYVLSVFTEELLQGGRYLLIIVTLTAGFANLAQVLNGTLQSRKFHKFAAINSGISFGLGLPISLIVAVYFYASGLISVFLVSYIFVCAFGIIKLRMHRQKKMIERAKYKDFLFFSLSGISASILFATASKILFSEGDPIEMAAFTIALQIRAASIFIAGVFGAEILSRYSELQISEKTISPRTIAKDTIRIAKATTPICLLLIVGAKLFSIFEIVEYIHIKAITMMAVAGLLTSLSVPLFRAITILQSELINTSIGLLAALISVALLLNAQYSATSYASIFLFNSAAQLFVSLLIFFWIKRR